MESTRNYDVITVGGALAGAAFAKAMADAGARVLVLERESRFRDRVRGEFLAPWGVAELRRLGLDARMRDECAREIPWFENYFMGARILRRDVINTSPLRLPVLNWVHSEMEEALLQAASDAGAEVRRGARVCGLTAGASPAVAVEESGGPREFKARIVVCADGRSSACRKWANFETNRDDYGLFIAGVLLEMPGVDPDTDCFVSNPVSGRAVFIAPQNQGRVRAYVGIPRDCDYRFQHAEDLPRFVDDSVAAGAPRSWYDSIRPLGPLATFDGADTSVDHPFKDGIALVGDAAASSDPTFGQGQALALRDARVLSENLLAGNDWTAAAHAYAAEHDRYYGATHLYCGWFGKLFIESGPEADARRARALPLLVQDPTRSPDVLFSGPDFPLDETARRRFFGEE
jgi:2-polyprenyl-6-methoxyphenol hydroxylase-like FAD-dependent oxidoreductase